MMNLPGPISSYLKADKDNDPNRLAQCFTANAVVHDENNEYRGIAAIKAWKEQSNLKYEYTVEPLHVTVKAESVVLHARLTGDFPTSPAELDYTFMIAHDKIAALDIA